MRPVIVLATLALTSCGNLQDTRRWSSMRQESTSAPLVTARVYIAPAAPLPQQSPISGLSDAGQAAYVTAVAQKSATPADLRRALSQPMGSPTGETPGQPVPDRIQRLVIVALDRPSTDYRPGDRIMRAVVRARPANFTFGGYTVAQTDRTSFDISTVTRGTSLKGDLTVSAPAGAPVGGSAGLTGERTTNVVAKLEESREVFSVDMEPECLRVVQESPQSADLTGNARIAATVRTEAPPQGGNPCGLPQGDVRLSGTDAGPRPFLMVKASPAFRAGRDAGAGSFSLGGLRTYPTQPLYAWVSVSFVLRRIDRGAESHEEGSQAVTLLSGTTAPACQVVLRPSELMPPLYIIQARDGVVGQKGGPPLAFTDFEVARAFRLWLGRTRPARFEGLAIEGSRLIGLQEVRYPLAIGDPCAATTAAGPPP